MVRLGRPGGGAVTGREAGERAATGEGQREAATFPSLDGMQTLGMWSPVAWREGGRVGGREGGGRRKIGGRKEGRKGGKERGREGEREDWRDEAMKYHQFRGEVEGGLPTHPLRGTLKLIVVILLLLLLCVWLKDGQALGDQRVIDVDILICRGVTETGGQYSILRGTGKKEEEEEKEEEERSGYGHTHKPQSSWQGGKGRKRQFTFADVTIAQMGLSLVI